MPVEREGNSSDVIFFVDYQTQPRKKVVINSVDYTTKVTTGSLRLGYNGQIWSGSLVIANPLGAFSFSIGDDVTIYLDRTGTTPTTPYFYGIVTQVSKQAGFYNLTIEGDDNILRDKVVTAEADGDGLSAFLSGLIQTHTPFEIDGIDTDNTPVYGSWSDVSLLSIIEEVCEANDKIFTIKHYDTDYAKDFVCHLFTRGTRECNTEAAVVTQNILTPPQYGPNRGTVFNNIIVYGASSSGQAPMSTRSDAASITAYGQRDKILNKQELKNFSAVDDYAAAYLAAHKDPKNTGSVQTTILPTLYPGYLLQVEYPYVSLEDWMEVIDINQNIGNTSIMSSNISFAQSSSVAVELHTQNRELKSSTRLNNPNAMKYGVMYDFSDPSLWVCSNCSVSEGQLIATSPAGNALSNESTLPQDVTSAELKCGGTHLSTFTISVSTDGSFFTPLTRNIPVTVPAGCKLTIKVQFGSETAQLDYVGVLVK